MSQSPEKNFRSFHDDEFLLFRPTQREMERPSLPDIEYCEGPPRSGGFGTVYKAKHQRLDRIVAIKILHQPTDSVSEAIHLAKYQHPNIVTVHDAGVTADGRRYMILEWLEGDSLAHQLQQGAKLTTRNWAELFERLAFAVDSVHIAGHIHRDIKPGNILFAGNNSEDWFRHPKLADFGLALNGSRGADGSGTRAYMAPEQKNGEPSRFSDVYSLGVTFWQCLTGRVSPNVSEHHYPLPMGNVPRTLEAILVKCMASSPIARYGTPELDLAHNAQRPALGMALDIRRYLNHQPTRARPLDRLQRLGLWAQRSPWQAAACTALATGMVGSGWFAYAESIARQKLQEATTQQLDAQRRANEATIQLLKETKEKLDAINNANVVRYASQLKRVQSHIAASNSEAAVVELDLCDPKLRGWEWEFLRSRCDTSLLRVSFRSPIQALGINPEGRVAVVCRDGDVYAGSWNGELLNKRIGGELPTRDVRRAFLTTDRLVTASSVTHGAVVAGVLNLHSLTESHSPAGVKASDPIRELFTPNDLVGDGPAIPVISADGANIIFLGERGELKTLNVTSGSVRTLVTKFPPVAALACRLSNAKPMLAALVGETVQFWSWTEMEPSDLKPLSPLTPQRGRLLDFAFTTDGTMVLVNERSEVSLWSFSDHWELAKQQPLEQRKGIIRLAANPNNNTFVTAGRTLTVWSTTEGGLRCRDLLGHTIPITAIAFSNDGKRLFSGDGDGNVREYNALPDSRISIEFRHAIDDPRVEATLIDGNRVTLDGREIKFRGLRLEPELKNEKSPPRLLISIDRQQVVVVDVSTREVVLEFSLPRDNDVTN